MDAFLKYLNDSINGLEIEAHKLNADNRKDEANLIKIKGNIFGITKAIYEWVQRHVLPDQQREMYIKRLNTEFMERWRESYQKAEAYNDRKKMLIEEVKLQTLEMIIKKFEEVS